MLEYGRKPQDFKYDESGVLVDEISIDDDGEEITVRTGLELLTDGDLNTILYVQQSYQHVFHISSKEDDILFCLRSASAKGSITHWVDGSTNQHVYVFEGLVGRIMEVEYFINKTPETWNYKYLALTEEFGTTLYGYYLPSDTFPTGNGYGRITAISSTIRSSYTNGFRLNGEDLINTNPPTGQPDSRIFDPFATWQVSPGFVPSWYNRADFFGGCVLYVSQNLNATVDKRNTCKAFIGHWR